MKRTLYISATLLFLLATFSCRKALKNVEDYYPEITTASAIVNAEGAVEVTANIESSGESALEYAGFCMDTLPVPDMRKNQEIVNDLSGSSFSTIYDMKFDPAKTYYFRSWAANAHGYVYGNVISLTGIKATPVEAPCTLNVNSSSIGIFGSGPGAANSVYQVTAVDHFSSTWDITATGYNSAAGTLRFRFGSDLKTKIYTTTSNNAFGDLVSISITSGFTSGSVDPGSKVYVNQKSAGVFEITICDAPWKVNGSSGGSTLNARFVSPL